MSYKEFILLSVMKIPLGVLNYANSFQTHNKAKMFRHVSILFPWKTVQIHITTNERFISGSL